MGESVPPFVLFTDLDGTLLDAGYRPGPASAALARLRGRGVPVVFCSSKTRAEQEPLRASLGVTEPFIVENGSAVLIPGPCDDLPAWHGYGLYLLGVGADRVRSVLGRLRDRVGLGYRGFGEMSVGAVARATGLDRAGAARARQRDFSETLVGLSIGERAVLEPALRAEGLQLASGGRFHTVTGAAADKGSALRWLMERLRRQHASRELGSVAVGDSENDLPMLAAADRAFVVAREGGAHVRLPGAEQLQGVGPAGFAELVDRLLGGGPAPAGPASRVRR